MRASSAEEKTVALSWALPGCGKRGKPQRAARVADDETAGQAVNTAHMFAGDHADQPAASFAAKVAQIHIDGCEPRPGRLGDDLPVVEADDRDGIGHGDTALAQRVGNTAGNLVIAAEDRIRRLAAGAEEL